MAELLLKLREQNVKFIRILVCDTCNVLRTQVFPLDRFFQVIVDEGASLTAAMMGMPALYDRVVSGTPVGEVRLIPDLESLCILANYPTHAVVFGNLHTSHHPFDLCPRTFLSRMIQQLHDREGVHVKAGFETEFVLLKRDSDSAVDKNHWCEAAALHSQSVCRFLDDLVSTLESMGIQVEKYHAESADGQFELVTGYDELLPAVDKLILTRQTLYAKAKEHGFRATLMPKPFQGQAGTASHVHLSLWTGDENVFSPKREDHMSGETLQMPSKLGQSFIAGILHHLPALLALTVPSPNSFARMQPGCWSGAYQIWGIENKEAAIRLIKDASRFEVKTLDATANPYLALGGMLAAGLDGLSCQFELDPPVQVDPGSCSLEQLKEADIQRLPTSPDKALALLKQNHCLKEAMGTDMLENFCAVRRHELESLKNMDAEEQRQFFINQY